MKKPLTPLSCFYLPIEILSSEREQVYRHGNHVKLAWGPALVRSDFDSSACLFASIRQCINAADVVFDPDHQAVLHGRRCFANQDDVIRLSYEPSCFYSGSGLSFGVVELFIPDACLGDDCINRVNGSRYLKPGVKIALENIRGFVIPRPRLWMFSALPFSGYKKFCYQNKVCFDLHFKSVFQVFKVLWIAQKMYSSSESMMSYLPRELIDRLVLDLMQLWPNISNPIVRMDYNINDDQQYQYWLTRWNQAKGNCIGKAIALFHEYSGGNIGVMARFFKRCSSYSCVGSMCCFFSNTKGGLYAAEIASVVSDSGDRWRNQYALQDLVNAVAKEVNLAELKTPDPLVDILNVIFYHTGVKSHQSYSDIPQEITIVKNH